MILKYISDWLQKSLRDIHCGITVYKLPNLKQQSF